MKFNLFVFILAACLSLISPSNGDAQNSASKTDDKDSTLEQTPVPTIAPTDESTLTPAPKTASPAARSSKSETNGKVLVIHKPMPSPSWGKVIQYHRDQIFALTDKNREVLHEFLFQDDDGIIRTAVYHENAEGDGYWEVWVWDQQ
jgi:hypothetical protein